MQAYQGEKDVQRVHQNDLSWEKQGRQKIPKKFIQSRDERQQKRKRKRKKPARLKTQKGSLGES